MRSHPSHTTTAVRVRPRFLHPPSSCKVHQTWCLPRVGVVSGVPGVEEARIVSYILGAHVLR
eukprot:4914586-Prymnesium_polylepis.1